MERSSPVIKKVGLIRRLRIIRIASKLHPPLPMSNRDSQHLRTHLNTSFRRQLNKFLPPVLESHNRHLQSILTNPHFTAAGGAWRPIVPSEPMAMFRKNVAAGTATIDVATNSLAAQYTKCLAYPIPTLGDAMRSSNTASTMVEWLRVSGESDLGILLAKPAFFRHLLSFLVVEKWYGPIWQWLQILQENLSSAPSDQAHDRERTVVAYKGLLKGVIRAEESLGSGLTGATGIFIQAVNKLKAADKWRLSKGCAHYLTERLQHVRKTPESQNIILAFMKTIGTIDKTNTYLSAQHWVFLAASPDPMVALRWLQAHDFDPKILSEASRQDMVKLELKTAELLLKDGRHKEALWVTDHLQKSFAKEIGDSAPPEQNESLEKSSDESEEISFRSLGALAT